jgi:hypothetical protein
VPQRQTAQQCSPNRSYCRRLGDSIAILEFEPFHLLVAESDRPHPRRQYPDSGCSATLPPTRVPRPAPGSIVKAEALAVITVLS